MAGKHEETEGLAIITVVNNTLSSTDRFDSIYGMVGQVVKPTDECVLAPAIGHTSYAANLDPSDASSIDIWAGEGPYNFRKVYNALDICTDMDEKMTVLKIKTFADVLTTRAITSTLRIAEHHLHNGLDSNKCCQGGHYAQLTNTTLTALCDQLNALGFIVEQHQGTFSKLTSNVLPDHTAETDLNKVVLMLWKTGEHPEGHPILETYAKLEFRENGTFSLVLHSSISRDELAGMANGILELFSDLIVAAPTQITYVSGFNTYDRPMTDDRILRIADNIKMEDCYYPYLPNGIDDYINGYLADGSERFLFLLGPSGTGKTTFISEICTRYTQGPIFQIVGEEVTSHRAFTSFFAELPKNSLLIIEDADAILTKREAGNTKMSTILNELSGLTNKNIRLIISTNLSSINKVDDALLRAGRLYQQTTFRELTGDEVATISRHTGDAYDLPVKDSYSLAEVMRGPVNNTKGAFGFNS